MTVMGYRELPASKHRPSNLRPICGSPPNHIDTRIDADQTPAPKLSNDFGGHGGVCDARRILQHRDSLEQEGQPKRRKQPVDEQFQRHARDRCCFAAPALGGSEAGESGILGPGVSSTSSTAKANPRRSNPPILPYLDGGAHNCSSLSLIASGDFTAINDRVPVFAIVTAYAGDGRCATFWFTLTRVLGLWPGLACSPEM